MRNATNVHFARQWHAPLRLALLLLASALLLSACSDGLVVLGNLLSGVLTVGLFLTTVSLKRVRQ